MNRCAKTSSFGETNEVIFHFLNSFYFNYEVFKTNQENQEFCNRLWKGLCSSTESKMYTRHTDLGLDWI